MYRRILQGQPLCLGILSRNTAGTDFLKLLQREC